MYSSLTKKQKKELHVLQALAWERQPTRISHQAA
jgi:hypothetical protein